jgi:small conductance mechanosensitive channel
MHLLAMAPQDQPIGFLKDIERHWQNDIISIIENKLPKFLVILLIVFALHRLVLFSVKRLRRRADHQVGSFHRAAQIRTSAAIIRATSYSIFGFIVFLQILNLLGIPYQPLLASAGILGIAIGLGAQSIFKDMLNGVLILVEDQYNVGEVVNIAGLKGTVEDLSLRRTTVRDADGTLYIIPNSQIATVSNLSRDYAVATLNISVDASANPDKVIALLTQVARDLRNDPAYKDITIADPNILGVDKIEGRSLTYPVQLRTRTMQRDPVLRELRRRIILAFEKDGIPLGNDTANLLLLRALSPNPTATPPQQSLTGS